MSEAKFTSEFLAQALKITTRSNTFFQFDRIWTDSRTLTPTDFFVALPGEKFDGHDFIPEAVQKGVRGFLVREDYLHPYLNGCFVLRASDTLKAFRKIAAAWRRDFRMPVVAVAGSVGKTTSKELLASLLSGKFKTAKTQGSQNGFVGIPMTLVSWEQDSQAAVVEIGIDDRGAMEDHLNLVHPTHGLITALGPEHLEQLGDMEGVFTEETKLFSYLRQAKGISFLNWDEPMLRERIKKDENVRTYSMEDPKVDFFGKVNGKNLTITPPTEDEMFRGSVEASVPRPAPSFDFTQDRLTLRGEITLPLPLPGVHNARNLLGAASVAISLGISAEEMRAGLAGFKTPYNRMGIKEAADGITWIYDYYNANPTSMEGAFQVLECEFKENSKILVLGDMLELGEESGTYHRSLASSVEKLNPKGVYLFGMEMRALQQELVEKKSLFPIQHFDDKEKLAKALWLTAKPGDVVLVKGSRGMKLEDIFSYLPNFLQHSEKSSP